MFYTSAFKADELKWGFQFSKFLWGQELFTLLGPKIVYTSEAKLRPRCPNMLRSRFWLQNQDFGASVGAICIIF